jgi:hypothetical protein
MLIVDYTEFNRYDRYSKDANSAFLRCYKALEAALKADAERGESADPPANPDASTAAGAAPDADGTSEPEIRILTIEPDAPSSESTEAPVGCVERTGGDPQTTIGAFHAPDQGADSPDGGPDTTLVAVHAPDEPIDPVDGPEPVEPAKPFPTNEPTVPTLDAIGSSIGTMTCVDEGGPSGTQREPSVPPSDGPGEPPLPASDGRFLLRRSAELLRLVVPEPNAPPRPGGGPWPAGPPGEARSGL